MTVVRVIYTNSEQKEVERLLTELGFGNYEMLDERLPAYKHRYPIDNPKGESSGVPSICVSTTSRLNDNIATETTRTRILFEYISSGDEFSKFGRDSRYEGLLSRLEGVIITNSSESCFY